MLFFLRNEWFDYKYCLFLLFSDFKNNSEKTKRRNMNNLTDSLATVFTTAVTPTVSNFTFISKIGGLESARYSVHPISSSQQHHSDHRL